MKVINKSLQTNKMELVLPQFLRLPIVSINSDAVLYIYEEPKPWSFPFQLIHLIDPSAHRSLFRVADISECNVFCIDKMNI